MIIYCHIYRFGYSYINICLNIDITIIVNLNSKFLIFLLKICLLLDYLDYTSFLIHLFLLKNI